MNSALNHEWSCLHFGFQNNECGKALPSELIPGRAMPDDVRPAELVLAVYNARYTHTALGLRWLLANLGEKPPRTAWHEFELRLPAEEAARRILAHRPRCVALGVYIWNVEKTTELLRCLRAADSRLGLVVGGPEVSAAPEAFPGFPLVDVVIQGEAEDIFGNICRGWLAGVRPAGRIIVAPVPDLARLVMPYALYSAEDLRCRHLYVESMRGCPHRCDFCASGSADGVREFPLESTLTALLDLVRRGARTLRFVDRTFNARPRRAARILDALRPWADHGLRLHLEFTPRAVYPAELRRALCAWPPGALHIELGIQTFNETVARRVQRPGATQADAALEFLLRSARAEVHADLIVGLPGEDLSSIAAGFDRLLHLGPQEIQFGLLKCLPGTPLERHATAWGLRFDSVPPYALQASDLLPAETITRLSRFAAYWERLGNHGRFPRTLQLLFSEVVSPFQAFLDWSDWLYDRVGCCHSLALDRLCTALFEYLTGPPGRPREAVRMALASDYLADGHRPVRSLPKCLRLHSNEQGKLKRRSMNLSDCQI